MLRRAEKRWWHGNQPLDLCHKGVLVAQYPPTTDPYHAFNFPTRHDGWLIDMTGTRCIGDDAARTLVENNQRVTSVEAPLHVVQDAFVMFVPWGEQSY